MNCTSMIWVCTVHLFSFEYTWSILLVVLLDLMYKLGLYSENCLGKFRDAYEHILLVIKFAYTIRVSKFHFFFG